MGVKLAAAFDTGRGGRRMSGDRACAWPGLGVRGAAIVAWSG